MSFQNILLGLFNTIYKVLLDSELTDKIIKEMKLKITFE